MIATWSTVPNFVTYHNVMIPQHNMSSFFNRKNDLKNYFAKPTLHGLKHRGFQMHKEPIIAKEKRSLERKERDKLIKKAKLERWVQCDSLLQRFS